MFYVRYIFLFFIIGSLISCKKEKCEQLVVFSDTVLNTLPMVGANYSINGDRMQLTVKKVNIDTTKYKIETPANYRECSGSINVVYNVDSLQVTISAYKKPSEILYTINGIGLNTDTIFKDEKDLLRSNFHLKAQREGKDTIFLNIKGFSIHKVK